LISFYDGGVLDRNASSGPNNEPIYRPAVSGYVAAQAVNNDLGFQQLFSLHQRVGDHRSLPSELQSWARAWHQRSREEGKREFGYEVQSSGFQIGQEVFVGSNASGGLSRAAVSIDYADADVDFSNRRRPWVGLSRDTGSLDATSLALGGYFTYAFQDGAYVDLVGQLASLRNKFRDAYGDSGTQKGWRAGVSVEAGMPVGSLGGWTFEPQVQLAYQYTKYCGFEDGVSSIGSYDADTLRARLGLRVFRDVEVAPGRKSTFYGIVNVVGDLLDPESVRIGDTSISERYGKSWGEVGLGAQGWVSKSTSIFGDVRYQQGFSSGNEKREGGTLNIGVRHSFF
jgi:autotransporter family porin